MTDRTHVRAYWVAENGARRSVWRSEAAAIGEIAALRASADDESANWTVVSESLEVSTVDAVRLFDSPDGQTHYWHAVWVCPHCLREHVTDIEPSDAAASQGLWCCERGRGLALVNWAGQSLGT